MSDDVDRGGSRYEWRSKLMLAQREETAARRDRRRGRDMGGWYFLGFVGSLWYYVSHGPVLTGIGKAILWPSFLVYHLLTLKG
jgi:hypothetical protein